MRRWPSRDPADLFSLFSIFICVWFLTESFGEVIFWKTGAIAYLWIMTFSILILNPFIDLLAERKIVENNKKRLIILPIAVLVVAISLENVSVSLAAFMLFAILLSRLQAIRLPLWIWLVALGQIIGTIILLAAPGNFIRYKEQDAGLTLYDRFNALIEVIWKHFAIDLPVVVRWHNTVQKLQ